MPYTIAYQANEAEETIPKVINNFQSNLIQEQIVISRYLDDTHNQMIKLSHCDLNSLNESEVVYNDLFFLEKQLMEISRLVSKLNQNQSLLFPENPVTMYFLDNVSFTPLSRQKTIVSPLLSLWNLVNHIKSR